MDANSIPELGEEQIPELSVISEETEISKGLVTWYCPNSEIEKCFNNAGTFVCSNYFQIGASEDYKIYFILYPNGKDAVTKNKVSLDLKFSQTLPNAINYHGRLFIVSEGGTIAYCSEFHHEENTPNIVSFDCFLHTNKLKSYIFEDHLIVKCSIEIGRVMVQSISDDRCASCNVDLKFDDYTGKLLSSKSFSDVTFRVHGGEICAHKSILSLRVPVFRILFNGAPAAENYFKLRNIDLATLKQLLHFVYTEEIPDMDFKLASNLFIAAHNYQVLDLKSICFAYLASHLNLKNVFIVMSVAHRCNDVSLKRVCIDFIKSNDSDSLANESVHSIN